MSRQRRSNDKDTWFNEMDGEIGEKIFDLSQNLTVTPPITRFGGWTTSSSS